MATTPPKVSTKMVLGGLPRKLVQDGLLDEAQAQEAFEKARQLKKPFVSYVVGNKLATSNAVAHAAAYEFQMPLVDMEYVDIEPETVQKVQAERLKDYNALPLFIRGNRLFVAVSDPTNPALEDIRFHVQMGIEPILVEEDKLSKSIVTALEAAEDDLSDLDDDELNDLDDMGEDVEQEEDAPSDSSEDAPVVKFVRRMLLDAIKREASDLHFEPYERFYRVRFRVDGILKQFARPPLSLSLKIAARIKVLSRMDVSERRVPQDGRIKLKLSKSKSIDFRVSTCPTLFGEKIVMRILNSDAASLNIDQLGYEDAQKQLYLNALAKPYGMVLVTGPTGSGKTVSLYTGINILNQEGVNISTAEDPVEINLPGINQVQIDERTGMTFERALKAFLRQDPDIILVGEIRDLTTGGIAIKAATTGHMVMSTLHTNDAPQTLTRMVDMGIAPFAIATAVNLVIAQRLARRLCPNCRRSIKVTSDVPRDPNSEIHQDALLEEGFTEDDLSSDFTLYRHNSEGCDSCSSGYKGRVGIYQVMPISEEMKRLIMSGKNAIDLADQARKEGIPDLRESGLKKVKDGVTSLEEVNRVTQE